MRVLLPAWFLLMLLTIQRVSALAEKRKQRTTGGLSWSPDIALMLPRDSILLREGF